MTTQEINLNFFSGFYNSIHDDCFDRDIDNILEDYPNKNSDDFDFKIDFLGYAKNYVKAINKELKFNLEFSELIQPREYNFTTDKIICNINADDLSKIESALNSDTMRNLVKENFTSRDGFWSSYSNDVDVWKENPLSEWSSIQLGTLLDAYLMDNGFNPEDEFNLDYQGYEYCSGNGNYVDYKKLWDEQAEKELLESTQNELSKLEKWNDAVKNW